MNHPAKHMTSKQVRDRFGGISEMTLWRWLHGGTGFPSPVMINRRRYWRVSDIEAFEAKPIVHSSAARNAGDPAPAEDETAITRRDRFAMAALQGIPAAFNRAGLTDQQRCERFARAAFMIADAMEAARKGGA